MIMYTGWFVFPCPFLCEELVSKLAQPWPQVRSKIWSLGSQQWKPQDALAPHRGRTGDFAKLTKLKGYPLIIYII